MFVTLLWTSIITSFSFSVYIIFHEFLFAFFVYFRQCSLRFFRNLPEKNGFFFGCFVKSLEQSTLHWYIYFFSVKWKLEPTNAITVYPFCSIRHSIFCIFVFLFIFFFKRRPLSWIQWNSEKIVIHRYLSTDAFYVYVYSGKYPERNWPFCCILFLLFHTFRTWKFLLKRTESASLEKSRAWIYIWDYHIRL